MLPILRYVSLGSKVYALLTVCCHDLNPNLSCKCRLSKPNNSNNFLKQHEFSRSDKLTLKGVSKIAKNQFTFEDYLYCLQSQSAQRTDDFRVTSKCQQISSILSVKQHYLDLWIKDTFLIVEFIPYPFLRIIIVDAMNLNATDTL